MNRDERIMERSRLESEAHRNATDPDLIKNAHEALKEFSGALAAPTTFEQQVAAALHKVTASCVDDGGVLAEMLAARVAAAIDAALYAADDQLGERIGLIYDPCEVAALAALRGEG